MTQENAFF